MRREATPARGQGAARSLAIACAFAALAVAVALVATSARATSGVDRSPTEGTAPALDPTQPGIDQFPSRGRIRVTLDDVPGQGRVTEEIELSSVGLQDTQVARGPLEDGTIPTEILAMQLRGESPTLGPVFVTAGRGYGLPPTRGQILDVELDGRWHDFSGDSFFDVFVQIDVPESPFGPVFARNEQPLELRSPIFDLPPNHPRSTPRRALAIDHVKCYGVRRTKLRTPPSKRTRRLLRQGRRSARKVVLDDQLERRRERVRTPVLLCNPVAKAFERDVSRVSNPRDHLVCYRIAGRRKGFEQEAVGVKNQFGAVTVDLLRREVLCLPSRKRVLRGKHRRVPHAGKPRRLSHFKCYTARGRGEPASLRVALADQFERRRERLGGPRRVCNPVAKNRSRVYNPLAHLACYPIARRKLSPRVVAVQNQFGLDVLTVRRRDSLCVPTHKTRCSEYAERARIPLLGPGGIRIGTIDSAIHVPFEADPEAACP